MQPGELINNRFLLGRRAGVGGMGEVYKAIDQETGAPVAVKALSVRRGGDGRRFAREARILSELDHPQIVRYVAHGALPSGEPYLAMEWLDGEDLSARLSRGRLGAGEAVALAARVAEALGFAHARGVVHRDLKPSNIFLVDGKIEAVKLLDFGIAQLDAGNRMTRTGKVIGTPGYMAPEQARGADRMDGRVDVFSLGCVLFECLTGERAFAGAHLMAVLARILFDAPPRVRERRPEVPEALDGLLDRMLAKTPEGRPRDSHEVAEALRALGEMPSIAPSRLPTEEVRSTTALTDSEQRAVAVILISAPLAERDDAENLHDGDTVDATPDDALLREAARHGGHLEHLLNGSAAVMLSSATMATDLASQAARCAIALRAISPGRAIALALGRGEVTGRLPMGPAIDRAAGLVGTTAERGDVPAEASPIVLDEVAAGLLDARFDVRERDAGFVLHAERELEEGTRTLLGKATPCVGRDWELGTLERMFDECLEERMARAVLVTAPAGVGKTRLGQEFWRHVNEHRTKVARWFGRGDPLRAGSAFGLLAQCIRRTSLILDGEPLELRREKLAARVSEHVAERDRRRVTEFLGEIISTPFPDDESLPLHAARRDAQLMNDQMRAAFLDFIAAECAAGPVLIGFEDLHWGDRPTVQFVDRALRDLHDQPLFVIGMARPEVHEVFPELWGERRLQEIRLAKLNRKAIERLARHALGERADRAMVQRLERLSEGNAFYLEELIRRAAEGRDADFPETVVAMVQSRLGALDDEVKRILRAASIFGEAFWAGGVSALLGGAENALRVRERLRELAEREFILKRAESRFPGEDELAFRHALLREGAYAMLTDGDRMLGHRLAGEWLLERGEQDALTLVEHFEKGGEKEQAARACLRAIELSSRAGDAPAALAYARRGLACGVSGDLRTALLGALCETQYWQLESIATALPHAEELVRTAPQGSAPWVRGMFTAQLCAAQAGKIDDFLTRLGVLLEVEPCVEGAFPLALAIATGVYLLDQLGRFKEATATVERLATLADSLGDREPLVPSTWHTIMALRTAATGDPAAALAHARAGASLGAAIDNRRFVDAGKMSLGFNEWLLGRPAEVQRSFEERTLPDTEMGYGSSIHPFTIAWMQAEQGIGDQGRERALALVAFGQSRRLPVDEARGRWVLAEVLRRAGELDAAEGEITIALEMLGAVSPLDQPGALATLAALRLAQGRPAEALTAAQEGMAKYESIGACSFFFRDAFLRLTHAECLEAMGDHAAARDAIARARHWILAVESKISDPSYRKSYLENVPENRRTLELARQWLGEGD